MTRKIINWSYVQARLGSNRSFWRLRYGLDWLNFRRLRASFQLKNRVSSVGSEVKYWRSLTQGTFVPIVSAVLVSLLLWLGEKNLSFFTDIDWVSGNAVGKYLLHPINNDFYVQMLAVIAGVTGVFLGLYFNSVSTVVSSDTYSSAPGDIRKLILQDRFGNKYISLVSFLAALSVILLGFSAANVPPSHLSIPLLAIVACLAIFVFLRLGLRSLFLSDDPTTLFGTISSEILKWEKMATYRGYQWHNPSFQEHYRKQALKSIVTLVSLAEFSGSRAELQSKSHPRLLNSMLSLVSLYYDDKHQIPSGSSWYGKKPQHKQWYLTDSTDVEMATQTDTTLQPTQVPHTTWLEDQILGAVFDAFRVDVKAGNYQALYQKMFVLPDFFGGIGGNWMAKDGIKWHSRISDDVLASIASNQDMDEVQEPNSIGVMDVLASIPMSIELGFIRAVNELDVDKLRQRLGHIKWSGETAPYQLSLPLETVKTLEQVNDGSIFEQLIQAHHKTPSWYITELVLHDLEMSLYSQWELLIEALESWYSKSGETLVKAKRYQQAAAIYSRAIEQAWKLDSHIEQLRTLFNKLREDRKTDFIKNANWDWDKEHDRVAKFRNVAIEGQAKLIPHLWNTKKPDPEMPDFFGGAVHYTGQACFDALVAGDTDRFKVLFRPYFLGILGVFENVRPQVTDWEQSSAIAWMSEPILELFDISGYAFIFAEYHNNPELWSECKAVWDTYLTDMPKQLEIISVISKYHQTPRMMITPRATLRSGREITLGRILNALPRQQSSHFYSQPRVEHQSQLIRNIAPWSDDLPSMFVDAIDVFTTKYLITLPNSTGLDFGISQDKISSINDKSEDEDE